MSSITPVLNLLEVLTTVLRDHDNAPDGKLRVVPCLTDDLEGCIDTIAAAVRQAGGVVLNTSTVRQSTESLADAENFQAAVPGTPPAGWTAVLTAALQVTRSDGVYRVAIEQIPSDTGRSFRHGIVDARYEPVDDASPADMLAPDQDPVLAVARALSSARLLDHRLAVLIYDDTALDASQRQPLWNLTEHLEDQPTSTLRTLVILARASVDLRRHAQPRTGFRYALRGAELLRRNDGVSLDVHVANILDSNAPFIGLFLGAGFSASSGLALGNSLRNDAIESMRCAPPGVSPDELALAFYRWAAADGRLLSSEKHADLHELAGTLTLERVLREHYVNFAGEAPPMMVDFRTQCAIALTRMGGAPQSLHRLMASGRRLVIATVNFDELIEHAPDPKTVAVFSSDQEFAKAPKQLRAYLNGTDNRVPVWKLHGTIGDLTTCVANDAVTLLGLSENKEKALQAVLPEGTKVPWIYVGASMRDTDLTPLLGRREFAAGLREYWVMPHSIGSVERFVYEHRAERWDTDRENDYTKRLITETADTFLKVLADRAQARSPLNTVRR